VGTLAREKGERTRRAKGEQAHEPEMFSQSRDHFKLVPIHEGGTEPGRRCRGILYVTSKSGPGTAIWAVMPRYYYPKLAVVKPNSPISQHPNLARVQQKANGEQRKANGETIATVFALLILEHVAL